MPIYDVHHSYPLEPSEKQSLAESITHLHATTFTTPSVFVHVRFSAHDATDHSYFIGGKPRTECTNHIIAYVRTSSSRSKSDFDTLAEKIEDAWRDAVYGEMITEGKDEGKRQKEVDELERDRIARKLLVVAFLPMVAIREGGLAIPEAGKEAEWYKENMSYFQKEADEKDDETYKDMLQELKERDDLKKMLGGSGGSGTLSSLMDGLKTGGEQAGEKLNGNPNGEGQAKATVDGKK